MAWLGMAWQGKELLNRESAVCRKHKLGKAWHGAAWRGWARHGKELLKRNTANAVDINTAWRGVAGQGEASYREARFV